MNDSEKPTNVLSIARDDTDHTKAFRLVHQTYSVCGVTSEPKIHAKTAAGIVYATTTCKVVIAGKIGTVVMSASEARELSKELIDALILVERQDKRRRGLTTYKIKETGNAAEVSHNGETMPLRRQRYTKPAKPWRANTCSNCRAVITAESWASDRVTDLGWGPKKRVGEIRICDECYPKLVVGNAPIALVKR